MIDVSELKAQMVRKGHNQRTLAEAIGSTEATVSRIFKNKTCGSKTSEKIIDVLGIENPGPIFFARKDTYEVSEQLGGDK